MDIFLDPQNQLIVGLTNTKDSNTLYDLAKDDFVFIAKLPLGRNIGRNDIGINYEYFGVAENKRKIYTATEYIREFNV